MAEITYEKSFTVVLQVSAESSTLPKKELLKLVKPQVDAGLEQDAEAFNFVAGCCTEDGQTYSYRVSLKPRKHNGYQKTETRKRRKA